MTRISLAIILLVLPFISLSGQEKGGEVGIWVGGAHYFGDLNDNFSFDRPGLSGGVIGRYNFNRRIAAKATFNYGRISGSDADSSNEFQRIRNLHFQSDVLDGSLNLEFNFLPFLHGSKDFFYSPYVFGGINFTNYNPKTEYNGELVELRELGTEGQFQGDEYGSWEMGLTYGMGLKISLNFHWSINLEFGLRHLQGDYLDDVSSNYPNPTELLSLRGPVALALSDRSIASPERPQIGQEGRLRGNASDNDAYAMFGIGITYFLGELLCPDISNRGVVPPKKKRKRR